MISKKIIELKDGLYNVETTVRILDISEPKIVNTKKGEAILREVTIGDETGRTKLTLWGEIGGELRIGGVFRISGVWTTTYKNRINLNAGSKTRFEEVDDQSFPSEDEIPEQSPYVFNDLEPKDDWKKKKKYNKNQYKKKGDYDEEDRLEWD